MRKAFFSFFLVAVVGAAMSFIACGDDDSSGREVITEVNSIFELGTCGEDNEGDTVYAKEQDAEYYCHEAKWSPVATPVSSSSAKSSTRGSIFWIWTI